MADVVKGMLVWVKNKKFRLIRFPRNDGTLSDPTTFPANELASSLKGRTEDVIEVELEMVGGRPVRIRPVGESWAVAPPPAARPAAPPPPARPVAGHSPPGTSARRPSDFVNPYNFLPAVRRDCKNREFGDRPPAGHDRLHDKRFTGRIAVTLTTETPLLMPDAARAEDVTADHKAFPVRVGPDGKPYLPPTGVKGVLRAAYEAVTNSRLGVFAGHADRLGIRTPARAGLRLVPARIEASPAGDRVVLYPGTSDIDPDRGPFDHGPMYAAWLPSYGNMSRNWGPLGRHGQEVWAFVTLWYHTEKNFAFWNVVELRPLAPNPPPHVPRDTRRPGRSQPDTSAAGQWVRGFVCVTNQNIDNKHDERVFFSTRETSLTCSLTDALRAEWRTLVADYQGVHADEVRRGRTGPPALTRSVWSRHVTGGPAERLLAPGTLCYAQVEPDPAGGLRVNSLYPVMISRGLFPAAPLDSLDPSLRPATAFDQLSPADRVFGWVNPSGKGAHRGQLRVGPVRCTTTDKPAVRDFPRPGLPLAILGQPKPQQVRFYLGDTDGHAQRPGLTKEQAGYTDGKQLRGRKVYPHHPDLPADYWTPSAADPTKTADPGRFREYVRLPPTERDNQNRSILGWVEPGTTFAFDLHVTNLSRVELGALVWLLTRPADQFFRFGLGKPLGFGSARLALDPTATAVHSGAEWQACFRAFADAPTSAVDPIEGAAAEFEAELRRAYGAEADRILGAFAVAARGVPGRPVHYPRDRRPGLPDPTGPVPPNPAGESYEWFVANDAGLQLPLPELTAADPGLPILPRRQGRH